MMTTRMYRSGFWGIGLGTAGAAAVLERRSIARLDDAPKGGSDGLHQEVQAFEALLRRTTDRERIKVERELLDVHRQWLEGSVARLVEERGALTHELEQRAKWEGIRSVEATRAKALEVRGLARAQEREREKKFKSAQEEEANKHLEKLRAGRADFVRKESTIQIEQIDRELKAAAEAEFERRKDAFEGAIAKTEEELVASLRERRDADFSKAQSVLNDMEARTTSVELQGLSARQVHDQEMTAHQLCSSALELKDKSSVDAIEKVLKVAEAARASTTSVLATAAMDSLMLAGKAPTKEELRERFSTVAREGRKAAFVPEGREYGALAYLLAGIADRVKIFGTSSVRGEGADKRINRALIYVQDMNLSKAVQELEHLEGLPATLCHDWLQEARARILIDQTVLSALEEAVSQLT